MLESEPHAAATAYPHAVVCGEALVDLVATAGGGLRPLPGGGPFNTARALARLGVPTAYLGRLSTDGFGRLLAGCLAEDGVDLSRASWGEEPTTLAVVELDHDGAATYKFYVEGTSAPHLLPQMLPADIGTDVTALHLGTLGLLMEPVGSTLTALAARERGARLLMIDLNVRPSLVRDAAAYRVRLESLIAMGSLVKASDADLAWLYPGDHPEAAATRILAGGAQAAVITLGAEGAFAVHPGGSVRVRAPRVEVVDTIGAGDAFGAALLAWLDERRLVAPQLALSDSELEAALEFAVRVAAITCTRAGAEPPRRDAEDQSGF
jgi:fructokinase